MEGFRDVWLWANRANTQEIVAAKSVADSVGLALFRGFPISSEDFLRWTDSLSGPHNATRLAPGARAPAGRRIGLHTEDAMLSSIPRWIWFYAAKPADRGGETILCEGSSVFSRLSRAGQSFLANDVLYWWRASGGLQVKESVMRDPPWIERDYRGPVVEQADGFLEISARC